MLARQQTSVILEKILEAHDRRWSIVGQYGESISSFKQKKNKDEFAKSRRSLDDKFKKCSSDIGKLGRALQGIDTEKSAKARVFPFLSLLLTLADPYIAAVHIIFCCSLPQPHLLPLLIAFFVRT